MLKIMVDGWNKNGNLLKAEFEKLEKEGKLNTITYEELLVVTYNTLLNFEDEYEYRDYYGINKEKITSINDGDYQGTLLFLVPFGYKNNPNYDQYFMTHVFYGSCSGCDALQKMNYDCKKGSEQVQIAMRLALTLVQNTTVPYGSGKEGFVSERYSPKPIMIDF